MRVECTYFPPLEKARGTRFATTWKRLCERLAQPRSTGSKGAAPGISLGTFRGNHRKLENVEAVYAVGLDLDSDLPPWKEVVHLFSGHEAFVHTTWTSTPEILRARVFLRLSRPVSGDEYRRVYRAVVDRVSGFGLTVDRAASDPSRFWYLPSRPATLEALNAELERKKLDPVDALPEWQHAICTGRPVNVDWALTTVPPEPPPAPVPERPRSVDHDKIVERARRWLAVRDPAIEGSGGDRHTWETTVCIVRGFDLDPETAYALLAEWNQRCVPPWTERDLRRKVREANERGQLPRGFLRDEPRRTP